MVGHPAGWLSFQHNPQECPLLPFEDARQAADHDRGTFAPRFVRPATPTERLLLTALGYSTPVTIDTVVQFTTHSVRTRTWPTLATEQGVPA